MTVLDPVTQKGFGHSPSLVERAGGVLLSEWTKLCSVRSTWWTLLVAAVTAVGGSALVATTSATSKHLPFDPLASVFISWLEYPVLAVGILGVLAFTSEYSSGQIRTTFTAVPQRRAVLAAKAGIVGMVTLGFGEVLAFASFLPSEAILAPHHRGLSLGEPRVAGAVAAAGFALFAIVMVGVGLGAVIRHTAGAIAALPAVIYLPLVALSLPSPWNERIAGFTLLGAASQLVSLHPHPGLPSPGVSLGVLAAWPAAILVCAAVVITRRDT